jgi:integrase
VALRVQASYRIPGVTAAVARAIFPAGKLIMRIYNDLEMLARDADFANLFPPQGQPAAAPARLALVTLLQFWEGLTDCQTADAVRTPITPEDMRRLCSLPDRSTLSGKRDAALLATLASSGLRVSELASLTVS